jgi:hypothetical protein
MELYPVGERFFQEFTIRQVLLNAAKNGSGPSAAGTSSRVEGPNFAEPAATASPAPGANPEPMDSAAPTASTPSSRQEHEAWEVLLACQGQLRLAPNGHAIGIDMGAALRLAPLAAITSQRCRSCCRPPKPAWSRPLAADRSPSE